jgi:alpha-tubulin suppressor-like RCC1 family protein
MAIKTDGAMWAWGHNQYGQLGQGDTSHRSSPVQIGALTTWSKIAGGGFFCTAIG